MSLAGSYDVIVLALSAHTRLCTEVQVLFTKANGKQKDVTRLVLLV